MADHDPFFVSLCTCYKLKVLEINDLKDFVTGPLFNSVTFDFNDCFQLFEAVFEEQDRYQTKNRQIDPVPEQPAKKDEHDADKCLQIDIAFSVLIQTTRPLIGTINELDSWRFSPNALNGYEGQSHLGII